VAGVYRWLRQNAEILGFQLERIAVGGDSAGGGLAAVLCQSLEADKQPFLQVLCYPGTDLSKAYPSYDAWANGYFLNRKVMRWFLNHYCPLELREEPRASPLLATSLSGQPPTLVLTAGLDPLQDEGKAYADKLERDGVSVDRMHVGPMVHGFITLIGVLPVAHSAVCNLASKVGARLRG